LIPGALLSSSCAATASGCDEKLPSTGQRCVACKLGEVARLTAECTLDAVGEQGVGAIEHVCEPRSRRSSATTRLACWPPSTSTTSRRAGANVCDVGRAGSDAEHCASAVAVRASSSTGLPLARAARARRDTNNPRNDLTSARASTPLGKTAGAQPQASTCELGHPESGRRCLIRNQVYPRGYRGFESLSLRRVKQGSRPAAPVSDIATAPLPSEVVWPQER
jgi:hypothetical protein